MSSVKVCGIVFMISMEDIHLKDDLTYDLEQLGNVVLVSEEYDQLIVEVEGDVSDVGSMQEEIETVVKKYIGREEEEHEEEVWKSDSDERVSEEVWDTKD